MECVHLGTHSQLLGSCAGRNKNHDAERAVQLNFMPHSPKVKRKGGYSCFLMLRLTLSPTL